MSRRSAATPSARVIAFDVLRSVLDKRQPLELALDGADASGLSSRDRAFMRLLVATTLRQLGRIDGVIDICLERRLPRRGQAVRTLLRMGICQLLFLETSPHAAVDTTVELVAARGGEAGYKGLINAVLRRVDRERVSMLDDVGTPSINTPAWLWDSWVAGYGAEGAEAIAAAHLREPPLDLTVKSDPAAWRDRLGATLLPTGSLR
ncbi:MAG: transcription antitermination protein NusB, partial [Dongiaceae bacterium]